MIAKLKSFNIRLFNIEQTKKSLFITAYLTLFVWIISLVMQTQETANEELIIHYLGVLCYAFVLFKVTPNEIDA